VALACTAHINQTTGFVVTKWWIDTYVQYMAMVDCCITDQRASDLVCSVCLDCAMQKVEEGKGGGQEPNFQIPDWGKGCRTGMPAM
jgi:hypothetical protein